MTMGLPEKWGVALYQPRYFDMDSDDQPVDLEVPFPHWDCPICAGYAPFWDTPSWRINLA